MAYECRILADSISQLGVRLTTLLVRFPRIILAEVNTHRVLSRNFESSRAVPVAKRIEAVRDDPFLPEAFGKNQRGMQATETLTGEQDEHARTVWLGSAYAACAQAEHLASLGVHKQLANRLIEPYSWVSGVISATEWENFFALRCHPDAQPEFQRLARMMRVAMEESHPVPIRFGDWHLPFGDPGDDWMVSAGRCARVSYNTHDGKRDTGADRELARRLIASGHMSPFEHQARPMASDGFLANFRGWHQARKGIPNEAVFRPGSSQ